MIVKIDVFSIKSIRTSFILRPWVDVDINDLTIFEHEVKDCFLHGSARCMRHFLQRRLVKLIQNSRSMPTARNSPYVMSLLQQFLQKCQVVLPVPLDYLHRVGITVLESKARLPFFYASIASRISDYVLVVARFEEEGFGLEMQGGLVDGQTSVLVLLAQSCGAFGVWN
jgi:hypothetical protein